MKVKIIDLNFAVVLLEQFMTDNSYKPTTEKDTAMTLFQTRTATSQILSHHDDNMQILSNKIALPTKDYRAGVKPVHESSSVNEPKINEDSIPRIASFKISNHVKNKPQTPGKDLLIDFSYNWSSEEFEASSGSYMEWHESAVLWTSVFCLCFLMNL